MHAPTKAVLEPNASSCTSRHALQPPPKSHAPPYTMAANKHGNSLPTIAPVKKNAPDNDDSIVPNNHPNFASFAPSSLDTTRPFPNAMVFPRPNTPHFLYHLPCPSLPKKIFPKILAWPPPMKRFTPPKFIDERRGANLYNLIYMIPNPPCLHHPPVPVQPPWDPYPPTPSNNNPTDCHYHPDRAPFPLPRRTGVDHGPKV